MPHNNALEASETKESPLFSIAEKGAGEVTSDDLRLEEADEPFVFCEDDRVVEAILPDGKLVARARINSAKGPKGLGRHFNSVVSLDKAGCPVIFVKKVEEVPGANAMPALLSHILGMADLTNAEGVFHAIGFQTEASVGKEVRGSRTLKFLDVDDCAETSIDLLRHHYNVATPPKIGYESQGFAHLRFTEGGAAEFAALLSMQKHVELMANSRDAEFDDDE